MKDPLTEREISPLCWDGLHFKRNKDKNGEVVTGCIGGLLCNCVCHDSPQPAQRKTQPVSLDLFEWRKENDGHRDE